MILGLFDLENCSVVTLLGYAACACGAKYTAVSNS